MNNWNVTSAAVIAAFISCSIAQAQICLPSQAVAEVEASSLSMSAEFARAAMHEIIEMTQASQNANEPGRPVGQQMSRQELQRFNDARHKLIGIQMSELAFSKYVRDIHLIDGLIAVAEISNRYNIKLEELPKDSPNRFYLTVLEALREAQINPIEGSPPENTDGCAMKLSLALQERFYMGDMSKNPTDKGSLNLILDIRRIEQYNFIASKRLQFSLDDAKNITWNGDEPTIKDQFSDWLKTQSTSMQSTGNIILPYVELMLPSQKTYEMKHTAAAAEAIKQEFPTTTGRRGN